MPSPQFSFQFSRFTPRQTACTPHIVWPTSQNFGDITPKEINKKRPLQYIYLPRYVKDFPAEGSFFCIPWVLYKPLPISVVYIRVGILFHIYSPRYIEDFPPEGSYFLYTGSFTNPCQYENLRDGILFMFPHLYF
jgi:hypothetical protein